MLTIDRINSFSPQGEPRLVCRQAKQSNALGQRVHDLPGPSPAEFADINADGQVDFIDFVALPNGFGATDATRSHGDLDSDGDFQDLELLTRNYGFSRPFSPQGIDLASSNDLATSRDRGHDGFLGVALQDELDETIEGLLLSEA